MVWHGGLVGVCSATLVLVLFMFCISCIVSGLSAVLIYMYVVVYYCLCINIGVMICGMGPCVASLPHMPGTV